MTDRGIAKIFMHGRGQAVRLPPAFRLRDGMAESYSDRAQAHLRA
jgi:virulence-associated protein VagC